MNTLNLKEMKAEGLKILNRFEGSVGIDLYKLTSEDCFKIAEAIKKIGYVKFIDEWKLKKQ